MKSILIVYFTEPIIPQILLLKHVINIKTINEVFYIFFSLCLVFEIRYAFYTYDTSQLELAMFQVLEICKWLVAPPLDRVALDYCSFNLDDSPSSGSPQG